MNGYYCGTCHNGKKELASCKTDYISKNSETCNRCHSPGKNVVKKSDFREFVKGWFREWLGNDVDWEKSEDQGLIVPVDFIEGISIKRDKLVDQKDFELGAKIEGMPDIIFSHRKHTVWNGCELCHPEIFIGIKKGITEYSMVEIFDGKYCGVCHRSVAFPLTDCQRCHTQEVQ